MEMRNVSTDSSRDLAAVTPNMHAYREDASPLHAQAHDHDYHAPELRHRENKTLALEDGGGAGGESGAKATVTVTVDEELVAKRMKEFEEHLEYLSEEPVALSDFMIANISKFRYFAYACGISYPRLYIRDCSSPWYFVLIFVVSWFFRVLFVYQTISSLLGFMTQANSWAGRSNDEAYKQTDPLWFCVNFFIFIQNFILIALLYDVCIKKRQILSFKGQLQYSEVSQSSIRDCAYFFAISLLCYIIYACLMAKLICSDDSARNLMYEYTAIGMHSVLPHGVFTEGACNDTSLSVFPSLSVTLFQVYVYCIYIMDLKATDSILIALNDVDNLTVKKYNAIRFLLDLKSSHSVFSISILILVSSLSAITFILVVVVLMIAKKKSNVDMSIVPITIYGIGSNFASIAILLSLTWKIATVNMHSKALTERIADRLPSYNIDKVADNLYIFQNQLLKPPLFLLLGFLPVYRNELVLSIIVYIASAAASLFAKSIH